MSVRRALRHPRMLAALVCALSAVGASAQDVGLTLTQNEITFFDTAVAAPIHTLLPPPLGFAWPLGDAVVSPDGTLGYVSRLNGQVLVYDLTLDPPALAAGTNVISLPTLADDLAISPDGKFLAVTGSGNALGSTYPIAVVDLSTRTVADTFAPSAPEHWAAAFGPDGSLLFATSPYVRRVTVDAVGKITDTGETFEPAPPSSGFVPPAANLEIAPSGSFGIAAYDGGPNSPGMVVSFTIPGLQEISRTRVQARFCDWAQVSPDGGRLFAMSAQLLNERGTLQAFVIDPVTGVIGRRVWSTMGVSMGGAFGADHVAVSADGARMYSEFKGKLIVRETGHGTTLTSSPLSPGKYVSTAVRR